MESANGEDNPPCRVVVVVVDGGRSRGHRKARRSHATFEYAKMFRVATSVRAMSFRLMKFVFVCDGIN